MKKRRMTVYRNRCKECGKEMLNSDSREQMCWRCKEELRKSFKRGNVWEK